MKMNQHIINSNKVIQRPTIAEINLNNLANNFQLIKEKAKGSKIMPMIKANAYGHGLIPIGSELEMLGADYLGVAFLEEGVALRNAGIQIPILVAGGIYSAQIESFLDHDLDITVSSIEKLNQVEAIATEKGKKARIHLKFDTGMERVGVHYYSAESFVEAAKKVKHCEIAGVYSHLACADSPDSLMTSLQLERFMDVLNLFDKSDIPIPLKHIANSGAIFNFPETHLDMVRPGIALYGGQPNTGPKKISGLKPVLSLKSKVCYFKVVKPNRPVSYGATWVTDRQTRVITVPIGYGDGYSRTLSSGGEVLVRGRKYPIVGRICMDQLMVNIDNGTAYNGDDVILIGEQGDERITIEDVAEKANTISYEILTGLNERIPRVYIS